MIDKTHWIPGTSLRMSRLFNQKSKTGVIVAMDHTFGGVHKGIERPGETIQKVLEGEPDGVILTPGTARMYQSEFVGRNAPALILSVDYVLFHSYPGHSKSVEEQGVVSSIEEALRLGADAVKVLMIFGREDPSMQARNFDNVARFAELCHQWGVPIMIEPTTWGHTFSEDHKKDYKVLRDMARIAFEFGADIVKCDYPTNPDEFNYISESCPVPVMVLGGTAKEDDKGLLQDVITLIEKGAAGVTFGRNVWQHPDPAKFIQCLKYCVYEKDLEKALGILAMAGRGK